MSPLGGEMMSAAGLQRRSALITTVANILVLGNALEKACIYNEWKGVLGWTADLRNIISGSLKEQKTSTSRMVPFILVEGAKWPQSDYLVVNMNGSNHPLPLTTGYQNLQPIHATPYTFLQAIYGLEYPVGMLYEEKILPLGKDITVVGMCSLKDGIFEIKSCRDFPYLVVPFLWSAKLLRNVPYADKLSEPL